MEDAVHQMVNENIEGVSDASAYLRYYLRIRSGVLICMYVHMYIILYVVTDTGLLHDAGLRSRRRGRTCYPEGAGSR
jgi:hypothetical protein